MIADTSRLFSSFPNHVPTAPLVTISLKKLVDRDAEEQERLFNASKSLGFFYLDMTECEDGESLLDESSTMFDLMENFYELPVKEKLKYDFAAEGSYFGYKGLGAEVIDGKGTKDKNEIYNVLFPQLSILHLTLTIYFRFRKMTSYPSALPFQRQM